MRGDLNELLKEMPLEVAGSVARYGVRIAIDLLETLYANLGEREAEAPPGRTTKVKPKALPAVKPEAPPGGTHYGWPATAEERSREMLRRREVRQAKAAFARKSAAARKRWAKMSAAQKQAQVQAMQRGKRQHGKTEAAA